MTSKNEERDVRTHVIPEHLGIAKTYPWYTLALTFMLTHSQYKIYLFEMILLCCKEININKPKNKMSTRSLVTKDGKPKLQLKGRIFMQNVTETISLGKPGMSTCSFLRFFR